MACMCAYVSKAKAKKKSKNQADLQQRLRGAGGTAKSERHLVKGYAASRES